MPSHTASPFISAQAVALQQCLRDESLPFGQEDSFKLSRGGLLTGRLMFGVRTHGIAEETVLRIADRLGMPPAFKPLLHERFHDANVVLFGVEQGPDECIHKLYLEFWDQVRDDVRRTGSRAAQLLNLGFKWRVGGNNPAGRVARYTCFPLLGTRECLVRMAGVYGAEREGSACDLAMDLVATAAARRPEASFIYMEAGEDGSPRRSFDINLYKAGLRLGDVREWLARVRDHYAIEKEAFDGFLAAVADRPLGPLSGGVDRHGRDFLTIYYEIEAL